MAATDPVTTFEISVIVTYESDKPKPTEADVLSAISESVFKTTAESQLSTAGIDAGVQGVNAGINFVA